MKDPPRTAHEPALQGSVATPVRPIFVLGSMRSGTTVVGKYLATSPAVCDLGEYAAFYFTRQVLPANYGVFPGPHNEAYVHALQRHATEFAAAVATGSGCSWFVDATPWNVLLGRALAAEFPDALFVLTLRHYSGTLQSLERSFQDGHATSGATWADRAELWARFYQAAALMPRDRVIAVGYDRLCASPEDVVDDLDRRLAAAGLDVSTLDRAAFGASHATTPVRKRAVVGAPGGGMRAIPSFDPAAWNPEINAQVESRVGPADELLRLLYPDVYVTPEGFPAA